MTPSDTVAVTPATRDVFRGPPPHRLLPDPEAEALFGEVDAVLCAALAAPPYPPGPPMIAPRRAPADPVRAVQRGPPISEPVREQPDNP